MEQAEEITGGRHEAHVSRAAETGADGEPTAFSWLPVTNEDSSLYPAFKVCPLSLYCYSYIY